MVVRVFTVPDKSTFWVDPAYLTPPSLQKLNLTKACKIFSDLVFVVLRVFSISCANPVFSAKCSAGVHSTMTELCLRGPGVPLAEPNPFRSRLRSTPGPRGVGRREFFFCPSYPGQVSCATSLGTTTVGMEAPHWPGRDPQVAVVYSTCDTAI